MKNSHSNITVIPFGKCYSIYENDNQAWPKQIPEDPDHYLWEFSFGGEPIFAFGNAPAYKQRKTRHLGNSLVIGFQPRTILMD